MRQAKILFIGLNYAPEPIGIGPYSAGLCEELVARGHSVRAVVGQPYYPEWQRYPDFRRRWTTTVENGVTVTRCPHYIPANPTGKRRLAHHASFASSCYPAARRIRRAFSPDLVFTVAPSLIAMPVALRMARRARVPLWLHVQDFEVGAAMATGLIDSESALAGAAAQFEQRMLRKADLVSAISAPMCSMLEEKGVAPQRILELRNWANHAATIMTADGARLRAEWGLEGKTVALYSGNIANKQGLEVVVETARLLRHRGDIAFVIAGDGPNRSRLGQLAQGLPNVFFQALQPVERVGELLTMADIHLLPQLRHTADLVLPSKLGNMLASGRPVIATVIPGSGVAQELVDCGVVVPPETPSAIAEAIEALAADPERRRSMGEIAMRRMHEAWSKDTIVDRFEEGLARLLS